ncbi:amidoligase family protein [Ectothiorhodospiraceae bacterium WFHF3C12]|nr:amidoligase family protein [Ectothiorhodospiraceae bacterium WFHF3C12]
MRDQQDEQFPLPEHLTNERGEVRRLGVELEFAGVELGQAARIIMGLYGGTHYADSHFEHRVAGTRWGDFVIEIDAAMLKDRTYIEYLKKLGFELDQEWQLRLDDILARIAGTVVPHEIACPPVPMTEAGELEKLRRALSEHSALGTRASPLYAFGLHLNPEVPRADGGTALAYLRAYLLLEDWLKVRSRIDFARQVVPFINDFPEAYVRQVVDPDYRPGLRQLMRDYLDANPTRNRPLDMLPLFAHLDGDWLFRQLPPNTLVRPRPTLHYRLPNCAIDEPDWTLAEEWRGWLAVEQLAHDPQAMEELGRRYLAQHRETLTGVDERWAHELSLWQNATTP